MSRLGLHPASPYRSRTARLLYLFEAAAPAA